MAEIGLGKGAGAGSFASGFGRGLSQALLLNRQRSDEKSQEERARKDRLFQTMLPVVLQNMEDPADLQPLLESQFPDIFTQAKKGGKKGESPFDRLKGFLGPLIGIQKHQPIGNDLPEQGGISGMLGREPGPFGSQPAPLSQQPEGVTGGTLGNRPVYEAQAGQVADIPPDISQTPAGGAVTPPEPPAPAHRTLFGVPMLTEEESAKRAGRRAGIAEGAKTEAELTAKMDIARRLIAQGMKPSEAYDRAGLRSTTTGATTVRYGGILKGDQAAPGTDDIYGRPLDPNTYYRLQIQPDMSLSYTPTVAPGGNLGVDREAIARAKFGGKAFAQLTPPEQQQVLDEEIKRSGEKTGATTSARIAEEAKAPLTTKQKFDALMSLQDDWRKADNPAREMQRQLQLMETGLKRAKADPVGGSQAVLVTFQKILDPTSVVRESEYARSGAGLALMDRLQGMVEKYSQGGAGVPLPVLEQMTETARQFLAGMQDWNDIERERIGSTAKDAGINPDRVFGVAGAKSTTPPPAERGGTTTPTGHKYTYDPATGQWK